VRRPSASLLTGIVVAGGHDAATVRAIARAPSLRGLLSLVFWCSHDLGSLESLYARVPRLRFLFVSAKRVVLGNLDLPALAHLSLSTAIESSLVRDLCRAPRPALRTLRLSGERGREIDLAELEPLLDGATFPVLHELTLGPIGERLSAALARSPLLSRLDTLELNDAAAVERFVARVPDGARRPRIVHPSSR
jgi:hypothetical protein